jgi:peptide/nickel transport system permease protein
VARVVRGMVLSLREREFVEAARALGASDLRIMLVHLVPNAMAVVIVNATLLVAGGVLGETALSFFGFGIQAPDTSLGLLVSAGEGAVDTRPWLFYFPGLFIILFALTVNFIGDGLRDALDPQQTRQRR